VSGVFALLRQRYPKSRYALFAEVGSSTGYHISRYADFVVAALWPSDNHELYGIELKEHRSDWLHELKQPEKSSAICEFCARWYLLSSKGVAKKEEIPPTWGWLELNDDYTAIRCWREADKREAVPLTRGFIMALLRRAQEYSPAKEEIEKAVNLRLRTEIDSHIVIVNELNKRWEKKFKDSERVIDEFNKRTGIDIRYDCWGPGDVTEAVKFLKTNGLEGVRADVERAAHTHEDCAKALRAVIEPAKDSRGAKGPAVAEEDEGAKEGDA